MSTFTYIDIVIFDTFALLVIYTFGISQYSHLDYSL